MKKFSINKLVLTIIILVSINNISFCQTFTLSPLQNEEYCAGINNQRTIEITLTNIVSDSLEIEGADGLRIVTRTNRTSNLLDLRVWFEEQFQNLPKLKFFRKFTNGSKTLITDIPFPNIKTLAGRNVFTPPVNNNSVSVLTCAQELNISIQKMSFIKAGSSETNTQNNFKAVDNYEYLLPPNIIPISGLQPSPGLPNHYRGSNNIRVRITDDFSGAVVQVRGLNECLFTQPSNFQPINIVRILPTLNGPNSINCGDVGIKTYSLTDIPTNNSCIVSYKWLIANKGWLWNGTIPQTDIVTSTPQINLVSANSASAPPQNISVEISTNNGQIYTTTRNVSFTTPLVQLFNDPPRPFNCDESNLRGQANNLPFGNYDIRWSSTNGGLFNGNILPQTNTVSSGIFSKTNSLGHLVSYSILASCGTFSASLEVNGCIEWLEFSTSDFYGPNFPGERLLANIEAGGYTNVEWFGFMNGTYIPINSGSGNANLNAEQWPCGSNVDVYVRGISNITGNVTYMYYVGSYEASCSSGYRIMLPKQNSISIQPNPAHDKFTITLNNKPTSPFISNDLQKLTPYLKQSTLKVEKISTKGIKNQKRENLLKPKSLKYIKEVRIYTTMGLLVSTQRFENSKEQVSISTSKLNNGNYIVEITDGGTKEQVPLVIKH